MRGDWEEGDWTNGKKLMINKEGDLQTIVFFLLRILIFKKERKKRKERTKLERALISAARLGIGSFVELFNFDIFKIFFFRLVEMIDRFQSLIRSVGRDER